MKSFGKHLNIYFFLERLKNEQEVQELYLRLQRAGTETKDSQRNSYKKAGEKLAHLGIFLDQNE